MGVRIFMSQRGLVVKIVIMDIKAYLSPDFAINSHSCKTNPAAKLIFLIHISSMNNTGVLGLYHISSIFYNIFIINLFL